MTHKAPPTRDTPALLNTSQAAEYLGISRKTMARYITAGEVPAARLGSTVRIRQADLDALFTGGTA